MVLYTARQKEKLQHISEDRRQKKNGRKEAPFAFGVVHWLRAPGPLLAEVVLEILVLPHPVHIVKQRSDLEDLHGLA